jgi:hypothetical protein
MLNWLTDPKLLGSGMVLSLVVVLLAMPAYHRADPKGFRRTLGTAGGLATFVLTILGIGVAIAAFIGYYGDSDGLRAYGRWFAALVHLELIAAIALGLPEILLLVFPKTGAVAMAAFRESIRQPMFWLIQTFTAFAMAFSVFIPYYTFGDDYKMMKMVGFDFVMIATGLFGVLAVSLSITEEIEGRTALTVISKPINRRSFLIGKYLGVLMACLTLTLCLAWHLNWALMLNSTQDKINVPNDEMANQAKELILPTMKSLIQHPQAEVFVEGMGLWLSDSTAHLLGVLLGFGQVMILVAIATALATRLAFVLNIVITLVVYFMGNMAPVIVKATKRDNEQSTAMALVRFFGQAFDNTLPALEHFQMNTAVVRDTPLDLHQFAAYVLTVLCYAVIYTCIGLLFGLLAFENRDLS